MGPKQLWCVKWTRCICGTLASFEIRLEPTWRLGGTAGTNSNEQGSRIWNHFNWDKQFHLADPIVARCESGQVNGRSSNTSLCFTVQIFKNFTTFVYEMGFSSQILSTHILYNSLFLKRVKPVIEISIFLEKKSKIQLLYDKKNGGQKLQPYHQNTKVADQVYYNL